jgi:hypothetical protein
MSMDFSLLPCLGLVLSRVSRARRGLPALATTGLGLPATLTLLSALWNLDHVSSPLFVLYLLSGRQPL